MPKLALDIPHTLTQEEAKQRLQGKFAAALAEHREQLSDFREEWCDNTFSFAFRAMGMAVSGTVAVEPKKISLAASLPMAAMFFKSAIEERLRAEVAKMLAASEAG